MYLSNYTIFMFVSIFSWFPGSGVIGIGVLAGACEVNKLKDLILASWWRGIVTSGISVFTCVIIVYISMRAGVLFQCLRVDITSLSFKFHV